MNLEVPRVRIQRETWCRSKVLAASHLDEFGFLNPCEVGLQGQLKSHDQFVSSSVSLLRSSQGRILKGLHVLRGLAGWFEGPG